MISFHDRPVFASDDFKAGVGIGIVANDVSHTDVVGAALLGRVLKDGFESFEVGVDISEKGNTHDAGNKGGKELRVGGGV